MKRSILVLGFCLITEFVFCQNQPPCLYKFNNDKCRVKGTLDNNQKYDGVYIRYLYECEQYIEIEKGNYSHGNKVGIWYEPIPNFILEEKQILFERILKENGLELLHGNPAIKYSGENYIQIPDVGEGDILYGTLSKYIFEVFKCPETNFLGKMVQLGKPIIRGYVWYENNEAITAWKETINSNTEALAINDKVRNTLTKLVISWKQPLELEKQKQIQRIDIEKKKQEDEKKRQEEIQQREQLLEKKKYHLGDIEYIKTQYNSFNNLIYKNQFQEAISVFSEYDDEEILKKYNGINDTPPFVFSTYNKAFAYWGLGEFDKSYILFESLKDKVFTEGYILNNFKSDVKNFKRNGTVFPDEKHFEKRLKNGLIIK